MRSEASPRMLHEMGQGLYLPTWTEVVITVACFSGLILLYAVFTRFFPIVPIWETANELPEHAAHGAHAESPQPVPEAAD